MMSIVVISFCSTNSMWAQVSPKFQNTAGFSSPFLLSESNVALNSVNNYLFSCDVNTTLWPSEDWQNDNFVLHIYNQIMWKAVKNWIGLGDAAYTNCTDCLNNSYIGITSFWPDCKCEKINSLTLKMSFSRKLLLGRVSSHNSKSLYRWWRQELSSTTGGDAVACWDPYKCCLHVLESH